MLFYSTVLFNRDCLNLLVGLNLFYSTLQRSSSSIWNNEYMISSIISYIFIIFYVTVNNTTYQSLQVLYEKYITPTSTLYFIFFTYPQSFHIRDILYVQDPAAIDSHDGLSRNESEISSVGEGKKHVEGRNRKRSEMERYRARRVWCAHKNRKGNPPRSSLALWHGGGGGEKGGREGEHALYFLIYPPLPISSRCIRKLTSILSGFTLHIVSRADSIARIKKLATPTLFSWFHFSIFEKSRDPIAKYLRRGFSWKFFPFPTGKEIHVEDNLPLWIITLNATF